MKNPFASEINELLAQNDNILLRSKVSGSMSRADSKQFDGNLAKIAQLRQQARTFREVGASIRAEKRAEQEAHEHVFRMLLTGKADAAIAAEVRGNDMLAGSAAVSFSSNGALGGVLVPMSFHKQVTEGLAAVDPLLDPEVSNVVYEDDFKLPPLQIPGWDISTIKAVKVTEANQHNSDTVPDETQKVLNKFTYRVSLGASLEWEDDQRTFDTAQAAMARAFGVGFARGIGEDLVKGDGVSAPQGVLTGAADSGVTTANAGKLVLADFTDIYFAVNKIYRASEKCAWLMNDTTYKMARNATDTNGRPLLDLSRGDEDARILGKRVHVCPSLSATAGQKGIVFGDMSHFYVHASTMLVRRRLQVPGYVENGKALYTGLMIADSVVHDPTDGAMPPIVSATLHA